MSAADYQITPFTADNYDALASVLNSVYPDYMETSAEYRERDGNRDPRMRWGRYLAQAGNNTIGVASYWQNPWTYHPQKFHVKVDVLASWRRRGIGAALYRQLRSALATFDPTVLLSRSREDFAGAHFLAGLGFAEMERSWESRLDPSDFILARYIGLEERLALEGIEITTMAELMNSDPDHKRKVYNLDWETSVDSPSSEPLTRPSLELYVRSTFDDPKVLPEAWFVALHGDKYVGVSSLNGGPANQNALYVDYTGVDPNYRRRGIALALKLRTIAYAQAHGNPVLITWNNSLNQPMLAINNQLGFQRQPAWVTYKKELTNH